MRKSPHSNETRPVPKAKSTVNPLVIRSILERQVSDGSVGNITRLNDEVKEIVSFLLTPSNIESVFFIDSSYNTLLGKITLQFIYNIASRVS